MSGQQNGNSSSGQIVPFKDKVNDFRSLLEKMKPQLALALPKHVKADRLARIVLTSVQRTPALLDCSRESLLGCVIQAAQLGLEPDGMLGHAYLIPFNQRGGGKVCQLIVGYRGMLKLARQSGELASISAHVVRLRDQFEYEFGLEESLVHRPAIAPTTKVRLKDEKGIEYDEERPDPNWEPGIVTFVYAVAKLKDGTKQFEVMNVFDIEKVRARSRAAESGPWVTDWEEMAKKTVIRRLCKMLPSSVELATAVALDERADAGVSQEMETIIDVTATELSPDAPESGQPGTPPTPEEPKTRLDKLTAAKKAGAKQPPIPLDQMSAKEREVWEATEGK